MATITVPASNVEDHLNESGTFNIQSFEWTKYGTEPDISFSVDQDLIFDDDDLIDIEEYNELETSYKQNKLLLEESEEELRTVKNQLKALQDEYNKLEVELDQHRAACYCDYNPLPLSLHKTKSFWPLWK